jgi:ornithine carbamoyltransferase
MSERGGMKGKDLVSVADLSRDELGRILNRAFDLKRETAPVLAGRTLALLFEKPSLRTRVSFDVAMHQLGGHTIYLPREEAGLGTREPISDMARVLSRYVDIIVARTFAHESVELLAEFATVPVINGLSDLEHPCQAISDLMTIYEKKGRLGGLSIAFIGDGNNVANSLILAATMMGMHFSFASPDGYWIQDEVLNLALSFASQNGTEVFLTQDPEAAVKDADVVYTDVWVSMGQEAEAEERRKVFAPYQVDARLLALAKEDAILMHPMPVHHGEELARGLIDCPQSVLIDQAENRLHAQKGILAEILEKR